MPQCLDERLYGWCGMCYSGRKGRRAFRGHRGYRAIRLRREIRGDEVALSRPVPQASGRPVAAELPPDGGFQCPVLREYLCSATWDDGTERETSTLLIFFADGVWKGCLSDRALERAGWGAGRTFSELLMTLERLLAEDRIEWRQKKPQGPRRGK